MANKTHNVQEGEWVEKIAVGHGCTLDAVWNDTLNQKLREKRANPNMLYKGDKLILPDPLTTRTENCGTDSKHMFRQKLAATTDLVINVQGFLEEAYEEKYEVDIGGKQFDGVSTGGEIKLKIPIKSDQGVLRFPDKNVTITLKVGYLSQVEPWNGQACEIEGLQARLNNLSFPSGPVDGLLGPKTREGTGQFQAWAITYSPGNGLSDAELSPYDSEPGPLTAGSLKKTYGM